MQQKGITPDTESNDLHTFAMHGYATLDILFSLNKLLKKIFFSHMFDSVLFVYIQDLYENLMMFWVIF